MDWLPILTALVGALAGAFGELLRARYSKSKQERDAGVAKEYLSLATITADELEKRINLIGKLDDDQRQLSSENYLLSKKIADLEERRKERDEHFESMEARIAALQAQVDADTRERNNLSTKLADLDSRYRVLWRYLIALLEQFRLHDIRPVEPPAELKSDPEIIRLLNPNTKEAKQ